MQTSRAAAALNFRACVFTQNTCLHFRATMLVHQVSPDDPRICTGQVQICSLLILGSSPSASLCIYYRFRATPFKSKPSHHVLCCCPLFQGNVLYVLFHRQLPAYSFAVVKVGPAPSRSTSPGLLVTLIFVFYFRFTGII